jgi:glutamine synthetase
MTPKDVLQLARDTQAVMLDLKFIDLFGAWQHTTVPIERLSESIFQEGFGFDGSSIRGFQPIFASDMVMIPDPTTVVLDPFPEHTTLSMICHVRDPLTHQPYSKDPRYIAEKAELYLKTTGIADTAYFGPEFEFFILDHVRFSQQPARGFYELDAEEAFWNTGDRSRPNLGYKVPQRGGYFPVSPTDSLMNIRTEMCLEMRKLGLIVEAQHHEVASGGQCEIDIQFNRLTTIADHSMWLKYIVKNVARRYGRSATFMPKPVAADNGTGMHVHQSLWKGDTALFAGNGYAGLSEMGLWYIGGILHHAPALCAFTNPSTNSYKRLVPGFEAPVNLAYSGRNRSASIRIPMVSSSPKSKRIEVRFPDPSANPYLAFSAMLMAGLDGIEKQMHPGAALERDIYHLAEDELKQIPKAPGSLEAALHALESDHEFLQKGGVFTDDVLSTYIEQKRAYDLAAQAGCPTPMEFVLYYDT